MENIITSEDLIRELSDLKQGTVIFIPLDKDVSNTLKLFNLKTMSYDNLFSSYINSTSEEADKFNLQKFLDIYSQLHIDREELMLNELISKVGYEAYQFMLKTNIMNNFDLELNVIKLTK